MQGSNPSGLGTAGRRTALREEGGRSPQSGTGRLADPGVTLEYNSQTMHKRVSADEIWWRGREGLGRDYIGRRRVSMNTRKAAGRGKNSESNNPDAIGTKWWETSAWGVGDRNKGTSVHRT